MTPHWLTGPLAYRAKYAELNFMNQTMNTAKHTPTPWTIRERTGRQHITPVDDEFLLCCAASGFDLHEAKANAQFIVRACNSHAALLEACKAATYWLETPETAKRISCDWREVLDKLRQAVSQAEKEGV